MTATSTIPKIRHPHLLKKLETLGFELRVEGEQLVLNGPPSQLTPDLQDLIRQFKGELLADLAARQSLFDECCAAVEGSRVWLEIETPLARAQDAYQAGVLTQAQVETIARQAVAHARQIPASWDEAKLSWYTRLMGGRFEVNSRRLQDTFEVVSDVKQASGRRPAYTTQEIKRLIQLEEEQIRAIHATKRTLDTEIVCLYGEDEEGATR